MNERWPPTPPLHRLPAMRSVFVASNRRAGLCRFVRPVCRNPILASIFSLTSLPAPLLPLVPLHHPCPSYNLRRPQHNRPDIFKGNLSIPRNGPDASAAASPPPWYPSFSTPQHTAPLISRDEVLSNLLSLELLLVDVRRADYEGGAIKGSLNLPAHSFHMNRGVLYDLCKRAGAKNIAFYYGEFALG